MQDVKVKHFALSCGVYGDEGGKPPIELFAAAIKSDEKTLYIALTIKPLPGSELDARAYGIKKVAIFSKDVNQKMLERVVDIVPQKGWERWVAQGSYGKDDPNLPPPVYPTRRDGAEESELDASGAAEAGEVEGAVGGDAVPMTTDAAAEEEQDESDEESEDAPAEEREESFAQGEADEGAEPAAEAFAEDGEGEGEAEGDNAEEQQSESASEADSEEDPESVFVDVETDAQAGSAVMDDIMGAEADEAAAQDYEEDPEEALARADFEAFNEVASAHRESQLLSAAGNGVGTEDGANPFLGRTSSADEEDDVGETWKTTTTPNHAAHSRGTTLAPSLLLST
jgi:hypothetical protein